MVDVEKVLRYEKKLKDILNIGDIEIAHIMADEVLCDLLHELGYFSIISLYEDVDKWYA